MNIYEINVSNEYRHIVDCIKNGLQNIFSRSHASEGDIYVVNHFPAATDGFGETELLLFINIPDIQGNYYWHREENRNYYLNNIVIGIKMLYDNSITDADELFLYSEEGRLDYKEELKNESNYLINFSKFHEQALKSCPYFYWIVTSGTKKAFSNDYIIFNAPLDISKILYSACHRTLFKRGINSFRKICDLGEIVKSYINEANSRTEIGILTKERIDKITDKKVATPLRALNNHGKAISILQGKAGCGKTLMLTRIFNNVISSGHHCRFLTYNNLLILDLKHCLCRMTAFRNTNAYIHSLHYFFYHLSKDMGVLSVFTESRLKELMDVCLQRIDIADEFILSLKDKIGKWPNNETFWDEYNDEIEEGDRSEITKYLKYLELMTYGAKSLSEIRESYLLERRDFLSTELGHEFFISDYNKVLENTYLLLDSPYEFYEKYNIKSRRQLLNIMSKTDKKEDDDLTNEYDYDEFSKDVQKTIMNKKGWSRNVLIDEAQDCNNYEKLILMKVYGAEKLIITSGGKDQLIRNSLVTDWTHALGKEIPADIISLPGRSYRQKANIVDFINTFGKFYKISEPIKSAHETHGLGRVILDLRTNVIGFSNDILNKIREEGKVYGCSDYENCMILLPTTGYSSGSIEKSIQIDELDNVDIIEKTTKRALNISNNDLKIWNGIVENKSKLPVPAANQTRFIYYNSCRGLEAWNVLCVDLDTFYYNMRASKDAEIYAVANSNLFAKKDEMKSEFALHWIYMAMTRPIDTLYIKLANTSNQFSQELINIANECNVEILMDSKESKRNETELPF